MGVRSLEVAYLSEMDADTGFVEAGAVRDKGVELAQAHASAQPFPHTVIDDFLPPKLLEACLAAFPALCDAAAAFDRDQERFKRQFNPDELAPQLRGLFYSFNSAPFIRVLENITGIKGLIPDPFYLGAGFHETAEGGHLSVHADFNHHKPMNLERRINVLIYLNKDWKEDFGGQLELWNEQMTEKVKSVTPDFNRCVIFNTTSTSYHGHPQKVRHPHGAARRSIALYYYTATWDGTRREHTTQFKVRPDASEKTDWRVKARELAADFTPPVLARSLRRFKASAGYKAP
jgi:hypothetical protein